MLQDYSDIELTAELRRREEERQRMIFNFVELVPLPQVEESIKSWMKERLSDDYHEDTDIDHYLVESVIQTFYGNDVYDRLREHDRLKEKNE